MSDDGTTSKERKPTPDEIRADIEEARAELADTVDMLTEKLDVKAQAGRKADEVKHAVAERAQHLKESAPAPVGSAVDSLAPYRKQIAIGAGASFVILLVVRRIRRRRSSS